MSKIQGKCPECGKETLIIKTDTICCNTCNKTVLREHPKTPESEQEIKKAFERYRKAKTPRNAIIYTCPEDRL
ncbi:MAG: hypothetical protein DWB56_06890 [Candidatus Jettenia sp.]|uniref:Uncharacterized protein n=1 Tax=Candidatus Jettenia caeni TaxID=247490 RepID=I3IMX3_9BACT|nr:LYR motif-containing protein [Candidatus Jettenia sp. AMX1]MBC6928680.1 hypothetical protein [Candidatus Jettenia sp.]NUN23431.1 LYR motif-containing protein [Candidatus Jettenia caeni]KAA0250658.1 MAG: LYR motif-containing protein [Candidatus Jettenia sp. AMX1]MCE7879992.1 LYR motif-containing protein [Candidatus Jettenia sp. AMX1]MCQ3926774.1 hypothetical protein [Candidatus Jettenia sp.]